MANPLNNTAWRMPDGRMAVNVTEAKTLTVDDSGYVQNVITDGVVITLPATATLGTWNIRNGGAVATGRPVGAGSGGTVRIDVAPNSADRIQGGVSGTAADNKKLINTKASSQVGDEITIVNCGETNGPIVQKIIGVWAREA